MIGLPITLLITLLIWHFYFYQTKTFTFLENSIIYMVITILATNVITLLSLNFKLINTTDNPLLFPAVLLYRDVIIPLLVLIISNVCFTGFSLRVKFINFIITFACLHGIEILLVLFDVFEFNKWNFFLSGIINTTYLLCGLGIAKIVLFISKRSLSNDNGL